MATLTFISARRNPPEFVIDLDGDRYQLSFASVAELVERVRARDEHSDEDRALFAALRRIRQADPNLTGTIVGRSFTTPQAEATEV